MREREVRGDTENGERRERETRKMRESEKEKCEEIREFGEREGEVEAWGGGEGGNSVDHTQRVLYRVAVPGSPFSFSDALLVPGTLVLLTYGAQQAEANGSDSSLCSFPHSLSLCSFPLSLSLCAHGTWRATRPRRMVAR